jgi:hypothetical protein
MPPEQPSASPVPPTSSPSPASPPWWKTRRGLTISAYLAFALAVGFLILAFIGQTTGFGSALVMVGIGIFWLWRAKKLPR